MTSKPRARPIALGATVLVLVLAALSAGARAQTAEVVHWWTSGGESAAVQELATAYRKAGGVWVDTAIGNAEVARTTIFNRIAGGKPPTAALFNASRQYFDLVDEGLLNDIDAVAVRDGWDRLLPEAIKNVVKIKGRYYALPLNLHNSTWFWYSKAVLRKAGVVGEPQSLAEFFTALDKVRAAGAIPLALGGQAWQEAQLFTTMLQASGGPELYRKFFSSRDGAVTQTPEFKQALTQFKRLKVYVDPGSPNRDWNLATALLIGDKAGFQVMGDWAKGEFLAARQTPGKEFGCFLAWGPKAPYVLEGDVFVFPKSSDPNARKAQALLATVAMTPAVQAAFNAKKGSIPVRPDVDVSRFDICSQQGLQALREPGRLLASSSQLMSPDKRGELEDIITNFWNTDQSVDAAARALGAMLKR
jgi:glucose/mannose transport system substrate-binding protein